MFGDDGDEFGMKGSRETDGRGKMRTVGVLERRANVTLVGGEVVIGKEARGDVKVCYSLTCFLFYESLSLIMTI